MRRLSRLLAFVAAFTAVPALASYCPNCVQQSGAIVVSHCAAWSGNQQIIDSGGACGAAGSVTSVGLSMPGIFTVAGSPVTTSGTITATLATQSANLVWAGPTSGSAAAPTFRSLVSADLAGSFTGITGVGTLTAGTWDATAIGLAYGGTGADLSATGAAHDVLKQSTSGGAVTVGQLACADLSDAGTACSGSLAAYLPLAGGTMTGTLTGWDAGTWNSSGINAVIIGNATPEPGHFTFLSATQHVTVEGVTSTGATGTGKFVFDTSPTIASLTVTGALTATGLVTNADLANSSMTIAGHSVSLGGTQAIACGDLSNATALCSASIAALANGGTGADLSATGAAHDVLKQSSAGAVVTVGRLACADLSDAGSGCSSAGSAGGSNTQVQYNNSGALGGITGATSDGTAFILASGDLKLSGSSSGTVILNAPATGGGTLTLPPGTDTVAGLGATQIFGAGSTWHGVKVGLAYGGTNADLSATGGASEVLKQTSVGGAVTVAQLACGDLSNSGTLCALSTLPLSDLAAQAADSLVMNATAGSAAPTAVAMPTSGTNGCAGAGDALQYSTTTHTWGCNSGIVAVGGFNTEMQYNNSGALGGTSGLTTTGTLVTASSNDFQLGGSASGGVKLNALSSAASGTLYFPNGNDDVATLGATQTFLSGSTWNGQPVGLAYGGTGADLSVTGGASQVLQQSTNGGAVTVGQLSCSDLSGGCGSGAPGGSNTQVQYNNSGAFGGMSNVTTDGTSLTIASGFLKFSGSGGAHQVLKQVTSGAAITVAQLACSDLSDATGLCSGTFPNQAANTVLGNFTGSSASAAVNAMPSCSGVSDALVYVSGTGISCHAITVSSGAGGSNTQLQYNNGGALAGIAPMVFDGTSVIAEGQLFDISNFSSPSHTVSIDSLSSGAGANVSIPDTYGLSNVVFAVLGVAEHWTGIQTFDNGVIKMGTGSNLATITNISASAAHTITLPNSTTTLVGTADFPSCSGSNKALTWDTSVFGCNTVTGTTPGGSSGQIQYNNSGSFGGISTTGSGNVVLASSPSIASLTVTTAFTATGLVTNADLANSAITIAGHSVSLGGTQAVACGDLSNGATGCSTATGTSGATIPLLNGANTWSGVQTYTNSDIRELGSSTGYTTITSANASSTNYTLTLPAATDTLVGQATTDTLTNKSIAGSEINSGTVAAARLPSDVVYYDANQSFTAAQRSTPSTISISTATFTPNFDTGQNFGITLVHASCPCTLANPSTTPVAGQSGIIVVNQSATGSDLISTWGSDYIYPGGTSTIALSTAASAIDVFSYYVIDSTHILLSTGALHATH